MVKSGQSVYRGEQANTAEAYLTEKDLNIKEYLTKGRSHVARIEIGANSGMITAFQRK